MTGGGASPHCEPQFHEHHRLPPIASIVQVSIQLLLTILSLLAATCHVCLAAMLAQPAAFLVPSVPIAPATSDRIRSSAESKASSVPRGSPSARRVRNTPLRCSNARPMAPRTMKRPTANEMA